MTPVRVQVSEQMVGLKLQQLLKRTGDKRTPRQAAERLGLSIRALTELVNQRELGNLAVDVCSCCGAHLQPAPAVACAHCVVGGWVCALLHAHACA